jgi:acyl-[acyl-carrier-protein] desaturase
VADRHPDHDLLAELEPVAEQLLDRHLSMAKEWLPHEYIPWSLGRDFDTEPWTPDQPRLTGVAQAAFEVNLLTEDNLPSYHHQLLASFGRDWAWRTWSHRWTAEEGRHAGVGIHGFTRKALQMAQAGIYDLRIHHDEILWPLLRHWDLFGLEGLDPQAEQARDRLATHLAKTDRLANRFEAKRAATAANEHSAAG